MNAQMNERLVALTEKEKQTLRLIVRGHDAKSTARSLGLSVHTINERLRDARRKMSVSSSREAARLLLEIEGESGPHFLGDSEIGEAPVVIPSDQVTGRSSRRPWIMIGVILMTLAFGFLALLAVSNTATPPQQPPVTATRSEVADIAQQWLTLVDQGKWDESYRATGTAFQKLNTARIWADTSEQVRVPLGPVVSRSFLSQENLPAPPAGYEVVKFRTSFANKPDTIETVTLEREKGSWRVVGVTIG